MTTKKPPHPLLLFSQVGRAKMLLIALILRLPLNIKTRLIRGFHILITPLGLLSRQVKNQPLIKQIRHDDRLNIRQRMQLRRQPGNVLPYQHCQSGVSRMLPGRPILKIAVITHDHQ
jgi:hypothetical protein